MVRTTSASWGTASYIAVLTPPTAAGDRHPSAHVQAFSAAGKIGVRHPLLDGLPLQLGEDDADIQHGPANGGGGVEFLGGGYKFHAVLCEGVHHGGEVQNGAADAVQLVDDDLADEAPPHVGHELLKGGALRVLSAVAPVGVGFGRPAPELVPAQLDLAFNGDAVGAVHRLSGIDGVHSVPPAVFRVLSWLQSIRRSGVKSLDKKLLQL